MNITLINATPATKSGAPSSLAALMAGVPGVDVIWPVGCTRAASLNFVPCFNMSVTSSARRVAIPRSCAALDFFLSCSSCSAKIRAPALSSGSGISSPTPSISDLGGPKFGSGDDSVTTRPSPPENFPSVSLRRWPPQPALSRPRAWRRPVRPPAPPRPTGRASSRACRPSTTRWPAPWPR